MFGIDDALLGGMAAGGSSLIGTWMTNSANKQIAREANALSIDLANTAYQRRVDDLQAAGLNPMLAYMQGGASTPDIKTATVEDPLTPAVNSALATKQNIQQGRILDKQVLQTDAAIQLTKDQSAAAQADANLKNANAEQVRATLPFSAASADLGNRLVQSQIDKIAKDILNIAKDIEVKDVNISKIKTDIDNQKADTALKRFQLVVNNLSYEQAKVLNPLLTQYQDLLNQAQTNKIPETKVNADFYNTVSGKASPYIKQFLPILKLIFHYAE